jgi:hypothetical protein
MVPPHRTCASCSQYFQPDLPNASLDKWKVVHRFDTVTKCKEDLLWFQKKAIRGSSKITNNSKKFRGLRQARPGGLRSAMAA